MTSSNDFASEKTKIKTKNKNFIEFIKYGDKEQYLNMYIL